MDTWIEIEEFAKTMPVGGMVHGRFSDGAAWRTAIFIQAGPMWLARLPKNPHVEMRFGMFNEKRAAPIFWMVRMGGEIFESWINWAGHGGREAIEDLAAQTEVVIHLYSRRARARSISVSNSLRGAAQDIIARLRDRGCWNDEDFERARKAIYDKYPTPEALWAAASVTGGRV